MRKVYFLSRTAWDYYEEDDVPFILGDIEERYALICFIGERLL